MINTIVNELTCKYFNIESNYSLSYFHKPGKNKEHVGVLSVVAFHCSSAFSIGGRTALQHFSVNKTFTCDQNIDLNSNQAEENTRCDGMYGSRNVR